MYVGHRCSRLRNTTGVSFDNTSTQAPTQTGLTNSTLSEDLKLLEPNYNVFRVPCWFTENERRIVQFDEYALSMFVYSFDVFDVKERLHVTISTGCVSAISLAHAVCAND